MRGVSLRLLVAAAAVLVCLCQKQIDKEQKLVKIGDRVYTRDQFNSFSVMARSYPSAMPHIFPANRKQITFMVETELLYRSIPFTFPRRKIRNGDDWKWKKRYFPAQMYTIEILNGNAGFMDKDLQDYYQAHRDAFKDTVTYTVDPPATDSSAGDSASVEKVERDSVRYRPFVEVRDQIMRTMFFHKYPPDSAFLAAHVSGEEEVDSAALRNQWFFHVRRTSRDFFVKEVYREVVGEEMPDSLDEWYGEGKLITPDDMEVIRGWIDESRRKYYNTPEGTKELAMWLLKWKIFSEKAKRVEYTENEELAEIMDWAWKVQVVTEYIEKNLLPKCEEMTDIDTSMCRFAYWDEVNSVVIPPDSAALAREIHTQYLKQLGVNLGSIIQDLREKKGVEFLQSDFKDDRNEDPKRILTKADSLRDSSQTDAAIEEYRKLTHNFPFTEEGEKAFAELAKLQTEKEMYSAAIDNYRRLLITEELDSERACNYFFMIGFIYDEYLNKPKLAGVQYKWLLKNTPECDLCDDAEFMVLHLDEPMISIEELRRQAKAQGRNVDYSSDEEVLETQPSAEEAVE